MKELKIRDYLIPKNNNDLWIIVYANWDSENKGNITVERINNFSSYIPVDLMYTKNFNDKDKMLEEYKKKRDEWNALVINGGSQSRRPTKQFLPPMQSS